MMVMLVVVVVVVETSMLSWTTICHYGVCVSQCIGRAEMLRDSVKMVTTIQRQQLR